MSLPPGIEIGEKQNPGPSQRSFVNTAAPFAWRRNEESSPPVVVNQAAPTFMRKNDANHNLAKSPNVHSYSRYEQQPLFTRSSSRQPGNLFRQEPSHLPEPPFIYRVPKIPPAHNEGLSFNVKEGPTVIIGDHPFKRAPTKSSKDEIKSHGIEKSTTENPFVEKIPPRHSIIKIEKPSREFSSNEAEQSDKRRSHTREKIIVDSSEIYLSDLKKKFDLLFKDEDLVDSIVEKTRSKLNDSSERYSSMNEFMETLFSKKLTTDDDKVTMDDPYIKPRSTPSPFSERRNREHLESLFKAKNKHFKSGTRSDSSQSMEEEDLMLKRSVQRVFKRQPQESIIDLEPAESGRGPIGWKQPVERQTLGDVPESPDRFNKRTDTSMETDAEEDFPCKKLKTKKTSAQRFFIPKYSNGILEHLPNHKIKNGSVSNYLDSISSENNIVYSRDKSNEKIYNIKEKLTYDSYPKSHGKYHSEEIIHGSSLNKDRFGKYKPTENYVFATSHNKDSFGKYSLKQKYAQGSSLGKGSYLSKRPSSADTFDQKIYEQHKETYRNPVPDKEIVVKTYYKIVDHESDSQNDKPISHVQQRPLKLKRKRTKRPTISSNLSTNIPLILGIPKASQINEITLANDKDIPFELETQASGGWGRDESKSKASTKRRKTLKRRIIEKQSLDDSYEARLAENVPTIESYRNVDLKDVKMFKTKINYIERD